MDDFYKMNVFFLVTTIAVVVVGVLLVVATAYVIKILNDIKYITRKAKTETDLLTQDLRELHENVKTEGSKLKHFGKFMSGIYKRHNKK